MLRLFHNSCCKMSCQSLIAARHVTPTHSFSTCSKVYLWRDPQPGPLHHKLTASPVRLMPLGGSITYGVGSSAGDGYRGYLRDILKAKGHDIKFVGSRKSGSMSNNDHEGWRGYRLDQIESKSRISGEAFVPDVFAINAGSNDCIQDFEIECFKERMSSMLESCWRICPLSTVLLSTTLVNADEQINSRVLRVNEQIRELVESKIAEGRSISLADMYGAEGPALHDLVDGTHPNNKGYLKMAVIWAEAYQKARM